jgi:hypothetical protein
VHSVVTHLGSINNGAVVVLSAAELEHSTVGGRRYASVPARAGRRCRAISHLAGDQCRKRGRRSNEYSVLHRGQ